MAKAIAGPVLKLRRAGREGRRIVELGAIHAWIGAALALGLFGAGLGLGLLIGGSTTAPAVAPTASPASPAPSERPGPALALGTAVSVGGAPAAVEPSTGPERVAPEPPRLGQIERALPERGYGLQLGAFDSEAEAMRFLNTHAAALAERTVYVVPTEIAGRGTWFRVRVGAEKSRREAEQLKGKLGELGAEALVVSHR